MADCVNKSTDQKADHTKKPTGKRIFKRSTFFLVEFLTQSQQFPTDSASSKTKIP
jgi:hypothetical protein